MRRVRLTLLALSALDALAGPPGAHAQIAPQTASESELKAAFLYNFILFTDWPRELPEYRVCVIGPSSPALARLESRSVRGRPLRMLDNPAPAQWRDCQVLYAANAASRREAWQATAGLPILTVCEGREAPGMLKLFVEEGHIRFAVDLDAARAAGLTFSSKLLRLARSIH